MKTKIFVNRSKSILSNALINVQRYIFLEAKGIQGVYSNIKHIKRTAKKTDLWNNGFDKISPLKSKLLDELVSAIENDLILHEEKSYAHKTIFDFSKFSKRDELIDFIFQEWTPRLELIFNRKLRLNDLNCWRNIGFDSKIVTGESIADRFHLDHDISPMLKIFVALSDVKETNGPFRALSRPTTAYLLRKGFVPRYKQSPAYIARLDKVSQIFTGPQFTSYACFTARCIHRATIPEIYTHRDMLELEYIPN